MDRDRTDTKQILLVGVGRLLCEALSQMLVGSGFAVQNGGASADAVVGQDTVDGSPPDIILLDSGGASGQMVADLTLLAKIYPKAKLVVFSATMTSRTLASAFASGASGYLLKDVSFPALVDSLGLVANGEKVFPTRLAEILAEIDATAQAAPGPTMQGPLTSREWQVLARIVEGDSNKHIAKCLDITESTVKVHLRRALRKIKARNRTQAAVWVLNRGLTPLPDALARTASTPEIVRPTPARGSGHVAISA